MNDRTPFDKHAPQPVTARVYCDVSDGCDTFLLTLYETLKKRRIAIGESSSGNCVSIVDISAKIEIARITDKRQAYLASREVACDSIQASFKNQNPPK